MHLESDILSRTIKNSPEIIEGIKSGLYQIYGGVIRVAKGHDKAGSIVAHLIVPSHSEQVQQCLENLQKTLSSQMSNLQGSIDILQGSVATLKTLQIANLAMSGLNLAVSAAGFIIVCHKLNQIDTLLQSHTQKLDTLLSLTLDNRQRQYFQDMAKFSAVIHTARQFVEMGDISQLKSLVIVFNEQYEFTNMMLKNAAREPNSQAFFESLPELSMLQERLMHIAMFRSFIQQKIGAPKYAVESLEKLQSDWLEINENIVSGVSESTDFLYQLTHAQGHKLLDFLTYRKDRIAALEYQCELLRLAEKRPDVLTLINACNDEILLLAA